MAFEMIQQATEANMPYRWVTGDCVYGDYDTLRLWLEAQHKNYVLCVSGKEYLQMGTQKLCVSELVKTLEEKNWFLASCGDGAKCDRVYDWLFIDLGVSVEVGWKCWLFVRKSRSDGELLAHVCFVPKDTGVLKLVEVVGMRWSVECCFAETKLEVGLDHYEVQSCAGWYRHVTFACLVHALLTYLSCVSLDGESFVGHRSSSCSLAVF
jgi:SRSO17 transposase